MIRKFCRYLSSAIDTVHLLVDYKTYKYRLPQLRQNVYSKDVIKVVFFTINIGMWKNDYLYKLLMDDPHFDPYIISFLIPSDDISFQERNQEEMRRFFQSKNYQYFNMYDFDDKKWFDIFNFKPDIVFYTQAVVFSYDNFGIKDLWHDTLFYYIPYCIGTEQTPDGYNTLLFNICDLVFAPSEDHRRQWSSLLLNKGENICVTGYPSFDYLTNKRANVESDVLWKGNRNRKRIIWSPHHTIGDEDPLAFSNFLNIADDMVLLAEQLKDTVQFVFKPHPRLRPKLEQRRDWGIERTRDYYNKWSAMSNSNYVDGEYYDLFLSSDAMIHDCSTFMVEYLLTGKPVSFLLKKDSKMHLNSYAQKCFNQHYIIETIYDIRNFINSVVVDGCDLKKESRQVFIKNELLPKNGINVSKAIYKNMISRVKLYSH